MSDALLVLWLATIGADRVDFLGGGGIFVLTPFLVLSPLVFVLEFRRLIGRDVEFCLPRYVPQYVLLATLFLCIVLISVLFSFDLPISLRRLGLLTTEVYATLWAAIFLANRENPERILLRGAYLGLLLVFISNAVQLVLWLSGSWHVGESSGAIIDMTPQIYGPFVPRLSGPSIDMNRGGFLTLIYLFLIFRFGKPSGVRNVFLALGIFSLIATLSRSVLLATFATGLLFWWKKHDIAISRLGVLGASVTIGLVATGLLARPETLDVLFEFVEPLGARFSFEEGSSSEHFALLERGWDVGTSSVKNALVGIGFGNSFTVVQDFFPGNKYGNFHSLYLTLWVESGVFALFMAVLLLTYPLARPGLYQPLIGGLIAFNFFYQTIAGNLLWFCLALAWAEVGTSEVATEGVPGSQSSAPRGMASTVPRSSANPARVTRSFDPLWPSP